MSVERGTVDLEWPRLVEAIRVRCTGPLAERLDALPIADEFEVARSAGARTAEARALLDRGEPLPLAGIREIGGALDRVEREGVLEGRALRAISSTLGAARALRRFLSRNKAELPALHAACSSDPTLDGLAEELIAAVEPDGTLSDSASRELGRLRTEVANLRARIVGRLEQLLLKHSDIVQDRFHTLRDGRYVIPIRTDAHEKLRGIVHGTSRSGATAFVEPSAIINQGNRLKMAQGELDREVQRILSILSARVRERVEEVRAVVDALETADLAHAAAKLAHELGFEVVALIDEPVLELRAARHPLLVLDALAHGHAETIIENDLSLRAGEGLVLSGPNAGGKTVALKVFGLAALMVRAGLPVPAGPGSRAGFFEDVLTDVGDEQSIQKNLSTFSAHIANLARVMDAAGPRALVLLDEVATGTDPDEGAALACSVIDALVGRGAAVAVTTHYERLKAFAFEDTRLRNASVGFDVESMVPTFILRADVPGSSSALAVARRFGMPDAIVADAEGRLSEQSRTFAQIVRRLEERFEELDAEKATAAEHTRAAEAIRARAETDASAAREKRDRAVAAEAKQIVAELREARAELAEARRQIRRQDRRALARARSTVDKVSELVEERLDESILAASHAIAPLERGDRVSPEALVVGAKFWVPRMRAEVTLVEAPQRGRARVAAGPVKLWVTVEELRTVDDAGAETSRRQMKEPAESAASERPARREEKARSIDNTLDVRGMRVDDAIPLTESFLDSLYGRSEPVAYLLHGVGSGALCEALRSHLEHHMDRYVSAFRPATIEEGGARLTVVYLR